MLIMKKTGPIMFICYFILHYNASKMFGLIVYFLLTLVMFGLNIYFLLSKIHW